MIFNIKEKSALDYISLYKEGPNAISVSGISMYKENILVKGKGFQVINRKGEIIKKINIDNILDIKSGLEYNIDPMGVRPASTFYFDNSPLRDHILHPVYPIVKKNNQISDYSIGVKIYLEMDSIEFLKIKYPEEIKTEYNNYGNLYYPYISLINNKVIYNFPYYSTIYHYYKNSLQSFNINSKYTSNKSKKNESKSLKEKFLFDQYSLRFKEMHYSESCRIYYRIHHDEKTIFENEIRRKSYIILMDEKLDVINEIQMPDEFNEFYFTSDDKIYFPLGNSSVKIQYIVTQQWLRIRRLP